MATSKFGFTLPQVEEDIRKYHRLLASSLRSDPHRPAHLLKLAGLQSKRNALSPQKGDLDNSITYLTEAVLLPFQPGRDTVYIFFQLASGLLSRFSVHERPEDLKSSLKYFRFLQISFSTFEAVGIPYGQFTSRLVRALADNLVSGFGDKIQDMEQMAALTDELLCSGVSISDLSFAILPFSGAVAKTFHLYDTTQPPERVIQVLRAAMMLIPDSRVSHALVHCLVHRFQTAHVIDDYEEAIAIADKIVAASSPGDNLTTTQINTIRLIQVLVTSRLTAYSSPEHLEDAIRRFRTLLCLPSLPDQDRAIFTRALGSYERQRSSYFDFTGEVPHDLHFSYVIFQTPDPASQIQEPADHLHEILTIVRNEETTTTDIEAAVERSRTLLPSNLDSSNLLSYLPASILANIFYQAHQRTNRLEYFDEAITAYRDLLKLSAPKALHFQAGYTLLGSLIVRWSMFHRRQDFEEIMQLFPKLANDESGEVYHRLEVSYQWAHTARLHAHPSLSTAYKTAMSLMPESLVFSPTLQIQHFRLVHAFGGRIGLPSDYASYQIESGQFNEAIETLERGRALLWSEMRGLRTHTDQLLAADPAVAEVFVAVNRDLEMVTMSFGQSESTEIGANEAGTGSHEGMDSTGRTVATQRRLLEDREKLIHYIQSFAGFENFLKPPSFDVLNSAAAHGPVIIINQSQFSSYIIILLKDSPPSVISTAPNFHDRANQLKEHLLRVRKEKGLDSKDYDLTLSSVLADLYELVGKPVIQRLRQLEVRDKSRVWWCPTGAFCSLPLHAMGPIPSDDGRELYFLDLYIPSYTPTLSALIESRKSGSHPKTFDKPSLLLVAQPETLPGAWGEINVLEAVGSPVTTLISEKATPTDVVANLKDHRFVHFVCHGLLETGKPFDASFELHGDKLTLLEIVRSQLPAAEFAFLSACHTAEVTEDSIADEGLHLAAAMQFCGFRSVIGTMWAMADTDGKDLSEYFYKSIFSESPGRRGAPYYERSAKALQFAVKKLRRKRGITLERWVNFVHYGA